MRLFLSALFVGLAAVGYIAVGSPQVANPTTAGILAGVVVDDTGAVVAGATVDLRGRVARRSNDGHRRWRPVPFREGLGRQLRDPRCHDRLPIGVDERRGRQRPADPGRAARLRAAVAVTRPGRKRSCASRPQSVAAAPPPAVSPIQRRCRRRGGIVGGHRVRTDAGRARQATTTPRPTTRSTRTAFTA